MIIKENKKKGTAFFFWGLLLLVVTSLLLGSIYQSLIPKQKYVAKGDTIFCGAETKRGDQFVEGKYTFLGAQYQTEEEVFDGASAVLLPANGENTYAFTIEHTDVIEHQKYRVSVWRLEEQPKSAVSALVVQGRQDSKFYKSTNFAIEKQANGWEKLSIQFQVEAVEVQNGFSVYVYNTGKHKVYFDNLMIEQLGIPEMTEMPFPALHLTIPNESLDKIKTYRKEALQRGLMSKQEKQWVDATITDEVGKVNQPAKIRLKGDWVDHLDGEKWSYRIQLKKGDSWNRLKEFSIQQPSTRNYLHEWILHQLWTKEDVLTTRYEFIPVFINEKYNGIYAIEEHFTKQIPEYNNRREGPIVKFSEEGFWEGIQRQYEHQNFYGRGNKLSSMAKEKAEISTFEESNVRKNPVLASQYQQARILMQQYLQGGTKVSDVFEINLLAKYYAIADIFHAYHGIVWHNQRFYYNPVINKLEPIGYDGFSDGVLEKYRLLGEGALDEKSMLNKTLFNRLLLDAEFVALYVQYLEAYSSSTYFNQFLSDHNSDWDKRLDMLQSEYSTYQPSLEKIQKDVAYVHSLVLPFNSSLIVNQGDSVHTLKVGNKHYLPLELVGTGRNSTTIDTPLPESIILPAHSPRALLSRLKKDGRIEHLDHVRYVDEEALHYQSWYEDISIPKRGDAQYLFFKPLGVDTLFAAPISVDQVAASQTRLQALQATKLTQYPDMIKVNGDEIIVNPGEWTLRKPLIFPKGKRVVLQTGTTLNLTEGAFVLSYSPVFSYGTEEEPILVNGVSANNKGFALLQCAEKSVFTYTQFSGLNYLSLEGMNIPGAVSFYESDVEFSHCYFKDNHCEDALNIVRSEFTLASSVFVNTFGDAFDGDFSKGIVKNCVYQNIGNDCMDFSGSIVTIKDTQLEGCGDKGISAGEQSDITAINVSVAGAVTAMASKDLSTLMARNVDIKDSNQGFVAFRKKTEYGPGYIVVNQYTANGVKQLYNIAAGSKLQLNEQLIIGEE